MTHGTEDPDARPGPAHAASGDRIADDAASDAAAPGSDGVDSTDAPSFDWTSTSPETNDGYLRTDAGPDPAYEPYPAGEPFPVEGYRTEEDQSEYPVEGYRPETAQEPAAQQWQPDYVDPYRPEDQRYAEQPPYPEQPTYGDQPSYGDQSTYGDQPAYGDQPSYGDQLSYGAQPAYGDQSAYRAQPAYGGQQGYADQQYPVPPSAHSAAQTGHPQPGQHSGYGAPPPVPAVPRPEDLLVPDKTPVGAQPASWGWRGRMNRVSGGMIKSRATPQELAVRQDIVDIQHSFSRPMTVVVVQPKGGAGKTPTTICLSAAFGAHRGGYVVGWDDNETRGTLSVRVSNPDSQQATVWDLLSDLHVFEQHEARVGDLNRYVRAQPDAHFDALVSDDNPGNMAQIGEREYQRLHKVLQRFYRIIVVDTGNNVRSPNWQAAVNSADQIVVVSTYQRDVGYSASWVLDHLAQTERADLARNAVTVLTAADPTTDKTVRDQLVPHFRARTRAVCEIPYDQELAHGGPIRWAQLAPATRNAWIGAGATIVRLLADDERQSGNARRA